MKQSKKEKENPGLSGPDLVLQRLYDENKALTKLMQQLEIRTPSPVNKDVGLKPEGESLFSEK